jgi:hypothetical protein
MPDERTSGADDAKVATLLHRTTADLEPDVPSLVDVAITRGRSKRRHRNLGAALAAAAVVGVVGVTLIVVPLGGSATNGVQPAGALATTSSTPTPAIKPTNAARTKPKPTLTPSSYPTGPMGGPIADIPVKAKDLPTKFKKLFPGKITPAEERTGRIIDNGKEDQTAHFRWNGFTTTVSFSAFNGTPAERCAVIQDDGPNGPRVTCTPQPDGTVLSTWRDDLSKYNEGIAQSASLLTKHGYEIAVISYDQGTKDGPVLAKEPPFSIAQLTQAATSTVWFH